MSGEKITSSSDLRRLRIEVTVQNIFFLFTTISSKTCTEHWHWAVDLFVCLYNRHTASPPGTELRTHKSGAQQRGSRHDGTLADFWFVVYYAATQPAIQLHQERLQVVRSN